MNEELRELIEDMMEWFKELEDKYSSKEEFELEYGDKYWIVRGDGIEYEIRYTDDWFDERAIENNAIFRTRGEAHFEAERLKVLRELEKLGSPFDYKSSNWFIYLDFDSDIDCFSRSGFRCAYGDYYFRSYDEAKEAIKTIGEDRIRKYLFKLED